MQEWQHLFVEVDALTQTQDPKRHDLMERIRKYGSQGWELVTLVNDRGVLWAAFKRPAPEPQASTPQPSPAAARIGGR